MNVVKKTKLINRYKRYDIEVEGNHNFVANGVVVHNSNVRLGLIREKNDEGVDVWRWAAGSHEVRRKQFDEKGRESVYWKCFTPDIKKMLLYLSGTLGELNIENIDGTPVNQYVSYPQRSVVLFGERYGSGVQDLKYGLENGRTNFLAFDCTLNGMYLDTKTKNHIFSIYDINQAPILYQGKFSHAKIAELTDGPSLLCLDQIREGVVITSMEECSTDTMERKQLKSISFDYLNRKGGTEYH